MFDNMTSDIYRQSEYYNGEKGFEANGLDLNITSKACYAFPILPPLLRSSSAWVPPLRDRERSHKRLKQTQNADKYSGINGGNSLNSLPGLHFRGHVWAYTQRYRAVEAMEEALKNGDGDDEVKEEERVDELRLVQQLIACAEAVACRDKSHASALLSEIRSNALVFGTSFQRVASCFVQGLSDRLVTVGVKPPLQNVKVNSEKQEALSLVYDICPQIQFGHFVANASILESLEGESSVHVVDLGMTLGLSHGHQWLDLMESLANRAGQPLSHLRITGVGVSAQRLKAIGDELEKYARTLGLNFEFLAIESNLENLKSENFKILDKEVLVINSILQLHCAVKESRGALNSVLQVLHKLSPKIMVLVEQDSSHNGPFFLGRFMEALHYYSAIFDSLDTILPKYDTKRAKIEQFYFAEEIKNIVSCEGPARVERHERFDQWRRRMSRAGFQGSPIKMLARAKQWLGKVQVCEGYTVVEEKGCLVLGWKSKPIVTASCWKCP